MIALAALLVLASAPAKAACAETTQDFNLTATDENMKTVLPLLVMDLAGQKFEAGQGVTLRIKRVRDLAWRGGVVGVAEVDFDHASISGTGALPFRVEPSLDAKAQTIRAHATVTGPIEILNSQVKGTVSVFGSVAEGGFSQVVKAVSETDTFKSEFARRADEAAKPISIVELVNALQGLLSVDVKQRYCITGAHLGELSPHLDALTVVGSVTIRSGTAPCCHSSPKGR